MFFLGWLEVVLEGPMPEWDPSAGKCRRTSPPMYRLVIEPTEWSLRDGVRAFLVE